MRRALIALLLISLALALGCAQKAVNEEPVVLINPKTGSVLKDKSGAPLLGVRKISDEAANYKAQEALAKSRRPVARMKAAPQTITTELYKLDDKGNVIYGVDGKPIVVGKRITQGYAPITLGGLKTFEVWGRNGMEVALQRYISQLEAVMDRILSSVERLAPYGAAIKIADTIASGSKGTNNHYDHSFNDNKGVQGTEGANITGGVIKADVSGEGNTSNPRTSPNNSPSETSSNGGNSLISGGN
jgi:predicted lipoprotein with Yx(FWY)xxD motif